MTWQQLALIAWFGLNALIYVFHAGRTMVLPISPVTAVGTTIWYGLLIWLVVSL